MSDITPAEVLSVESSSQVIKAIIERDYTDIRKVRYIEACPVRIRPLVSPDVVVKTVKQINEILEGLTAFGGPKEVMENAISALTLYLANPLLPHGSKACLDRLTKFIDNENTTVYLPLGLRLANPVSQGMLQLEFHVIEE